MGDIIIFVVLAILSSALSGSKKAKQEREKRLREQKRSGRAETAVPRTVHSEERRAAAHKEAGKGKKPPQSVPKKSAAKKEAPIAERQVRREGKAPECDVKLAAHTHHSAPKPVSASVKPLSASVKADLKPTKTALQMEQERKREGQSEESFHLGTSQKEILSGIIWAEVLDKPKTCAYARRR